MRRFYFFSLLLLGFLLNSCTENSTQESPPKSQDRDLTIWWSQGFYPEEDQALETAIEQWQQQENLKVNLKFVHEDDLLPLTLKALEDKTPPDILFSVRADFIATIAAFPSLEFIAFWNGRMWHY
ncbi:MULTISPECIES: hypothetical protein [Spirulina sp. CCY15215]|uniref:hypothetical protein n=1 Tax=Spirulina sp. CCY15215 TaxID=2767591 RepID=UPI0019503F89|nr:hypothetical protein [Spirulina major]